MSTYTFPGRVPDLVQDVSLKRARTEVEIDGEKKDVIRVLPAGAPNLDAQGVADAMGMQASEVLTGSVLSSLNQGLASDIIRNSTLVGIETNTDVLGTKSDAAITPTQDGSISSRLKMISSYDKTTSDNSSSTVDVLGSKNDTSVSSSYNGSINGRLRYISGEVHVSADYLGNVASGTGLPSHAPWDGTAHASLVSIEKRTSNDTHAAAEVLGTTNDASVTYNNTGTINARLRDISEQTSRTQGALGVLQTYIGSTSQSAWSGSGGGNLNAIAKRTSNDTNATATATGTQSDAAWSGTGDGTVIALLKGIYNKL